MTSTTTPTTQQTTPAQTTSPSRDHTMNHHHRTPLARAITYLAYFLGLLLLTALWTVYGPTYDARALPTDATSTASDPCPAGEATGGTCGTEGPVGAPNTSPQADTPTPSSGASPTPQRRCKGCRLTQEEYDARQADKQAAHDRAEARKQRGAERRAEAERKREERAARKSSKSSPAKSSRSHASKASESSSDGLPAQDGTSTPADTLSSSEDAPEASSTNSDDSPAASAPYTPLEIPEASRRPAPYDASKDPFEVRREAARQAADAVNSSASRSASPGQIKAPSLPSTSSTGYWAEQMPTWALGLIGFLAAAGIFTYKVSRPRNDGDRRS